MDLTAQEYHRRDLARLDEVLAGPPVTWVFLGDSITQGLTHTHGRRGYVEHVAERIRGELGRRRDAIINSGVAGATSADVLPELHWRAGRFSPDIVFVMFGTNDSIEGADGIRQFRYELGQIVHGCRDLGSMVVLQTPPPVLPGTARTPEAVAQYAEAVREVADDLGVLVVDHHRDWTRDGDVDRDRFDDEIHPGARGHLALAGTLLTALGIAGSDCSVCRLVAADAR